MESPQHSLLLYSKYSQGCKLFFSMLENNNLSEPLRTMKLQFLAIDNQQIRKSVKNSILGITHVPCLLIFYVNGTVEKFDGGRLFDWLRNIAAKFAPPQPQPPFQVEAPQEKKRKRNVNEDVENVEDEEQELKRVIETESEKNRKEYLRRKAAEEDSPQEQEPPQRGSRGYKQETISGGYKHEATSEEKLSSIPEEHTPLTEEADEVSARHRKITQPKRLRQNNNGYVEDEELFPGDPVELREPRNSVRSVARSITNKGSQEDPHGTMARAKALAQGREEIEHQTANPQKRPFSARRH